MKYLLPILFFAGCVQISGPQIPIPNGIFVQKTTGYPGVVEILTPDSGLCTGFAIAPNAILTAAHCTLTSGTYEIVDKTFLGDTNTFIPFGNGSVGDTEDISVLKLEFNLFSSDSIYSIGHSVAVGDNIRMVGFGCDSTASEVGAGIKRTGVNQLYAFSEGFLQFLSHQMAPPADAIVDYSNNSGTCPGDSGGPAIVTINGNDTMVVVGVVHSGAVDPEEHLDISNFVDLTLEANQNFLHQVSSSSGLDIRFQ